MNPFFNVHTPLTDDHIAFFRDNGYVRYDNDANEVSQ